MVVIRSVAKGLGVVAVIASLACLTALTVRFGFDHGDYELRTIDRIITGCNIVFLVNILFNLALNFKETVKDSRIVWCWRSISCFRFLVSLPYMSIIIWYVSIRRK